MSAPAIEPGMWVECVDAEDSLGLLSHRGLYAAEEVKAAPWGSRCYRCGGHGVDVKVSGVDFFWCAGRFQPVYRPKSEIIQQLLQPAPPVREPEHA